ncbi:MAG: hypothetical protein DMF50_11095 [Acidobacteria bacterium]|nr:MAG: hypothetical protein DMF50_11095 [Acidobacteriota bacterium]
MQVVFPWPTLQAFGELFTLWQTKVPSGCWLHRVSLQLRGSASLPPRLASERAEAYGVPRSVEYPEDTSAATMAAVMTTKRTVEMGMIRMAGLLGDGPIRFSRLL